MDSLRDCLDHDPTVPSLGKTAQAAVSASHLEDSTHGSMMARRGDQLSRMGLDRR